MSRVTLGVKVWKPECMPKRYLIVCGLVGILTGLVEIMSLGWLMPHWTVPTASYFSKQWSRRIQAISTLLQAHVDIARSGGKW